MLLRSSQVEGMWPSAMARSICCVDRPLNRNCLVPLIAAIDDRRRLNRRNRRNLEAESSKFVVE